MNIKKYQQQSDEYNKFLKRIAELAAKSIEDSQREAEKSSDEATEHAKDNIASYGRYASDEYEKNVRLQKEKQKIIADLQAKGIYDYKDLREKDFNELKIQLSNREISEEEYYSRLAELRDTYFDEGSNEWTKYTLDIAKYNNSVIDKQKETIKKLIDGVREATDDTFSKYEDRFNELQSKQNNLKNKLRGISQIYDTVEFEDGKGKSYRWLQLSDINTELELIKNFNTNFIEARKKIDGIFDGFNFDSKRTAKLKSDFTEEILSMSTFDATGFSRYLTSMPAEKLSDYLSKWAEKNELETLIPADIYKEESEQLADEYAKDMSDSFTKSLEKHFGEIPDSFFDSGGKSAQQFKNGFVEELGDVMQELSTKVNQGLSKIIPNISFAGESGQVSNYSNYYNIYGSGDPYQSALEIYKNEEKKRMLTGE